jgi:ABC-2 type transport system ATP-binding protein
MIVNFRDVVKRYGQHQVLDHVNFDIKKGEIIGLLGPNGAGKTTTIKALMGLIGIDSGNIALFDEKLNENKNSIKKRIGMVPQEVVVFNDLTARENLNFFGELYGIKGKELKDRVTEVLGFIGLLEYEKSLPKKFSGGMKRRLNIGCALVHKPELLIMDEPTVGIDPQSRNHILEAVRKLGEGGTTVVYTTHYMEEVQSLCSRILIMDAGHIIANGSVRELINKLNFEEKTRLEVKKLSPELIQNLRSEKGIKDVIVEGNKLTLLSQSGANNLEEILKAAQSSGIISIQSETPTLEDVFLTLTGKTLRDEEE